MWHNIMGKYILVKVFYIAYFLFSACHLTYKLFKTARVHHVVCLKFFQLLITNSSSYEELSSIYSLYSERNCGESGFISQRVTERANASILSCRDDDIQVKSHRHVSFFIIDNSSIKCKFTIQWTTALL